MRDSSYLSRKLCVSLSAMLRATVSCVVLGTSAGAFGLPMSLTKFQFNADIAGLTTSVEDFESYVTGDFASPFLIANGTFTSGAPRVQASPAFCGDVDQCLFDSSSADGLRTFHAFPGGTQFWGADLKLVDATDTLKITVTGGGGVLLLRVSGVDFAGFTDPLGLASVEFENLGTDAGNGNIGFGNYSFDNVTTALSPAVVPEPATTALVGLAFAGAWAMIRRRTNNPPRFGAVVRLQ
jgi:PEP-CTERM motif